MRSFQLKHKFSRSFLGLFFTGSLGLGLGLGCISLSACAPQDLSQDKNKIQAPASNPSNPADPSGIPPVVLTGEQKGELLIANLTHGYVKVTENFEAPGGLIGYVIQPVGKKRGNIIYTDQSGEYLFSGNIVNAAGENLTQQQTNTYIDSKLVGEMYQGASQLNFFTQGNDAAPHKMYIIFDPNCSICHMVFNLVQPMIDAGDLQVRWVPVGIMQASSVGKAAAIMIGADNDARVALLKQDENNFDLKIQLINSLFNRAVCWQTIAQPNSLFALP
jgi:thiol:disulfide interchange protein DsbG